MFSGRAAVDDKANVLQQMIVPINWIVHTGWRSTRAATRVRLNRWAFHRAITAKNTTVARLRPEQGFTRGAFVIPLAGISRHGFFTAGAACRTGDSALQHNGLRDAHFFTVV